ncbi:long-chain-fatty-acid--CoA ligase [Bacteroidota bacterium]
MILGDIVRRNARRYPTKTAVVLGSHRSNFNEFNHRVNSLANALLGLGMQQQDRVAILLDNCLQYIELYFAIPKASGIVMPLNTTLSKPEMASIINHAGARILVFGDMFVPIIDSLLSQLDSVETMVVVGNPTKGVMNYEELVKQYPPTEPEVEVGEEDIAYLLYSSGTTGMPKGTMVTHRAIIESALNYVLGCHLRHEDIGLLVTPLFYAAIPIAIVMPQFYMGATLIVADSFTPEAILKLVQKEKVTISFMTSPMIMAIAEHFQFADYNISSLRHVWFGGVPMPVESLKRVMKTCGTIFFQSYGMVEITSLTAVVPEELAIDSPPEKVKRLGSCGREAHNVEVRVVDDEGQDVVSGEVGEVIGKGDNLMKGYWQMPQATEEALKDGYMHTGDLATMDDDGYIYVMGRKKDLIISKGKNIYAVEIEETICQHPSVVEAAAIGVPDRKLGESIKAVVAIRKGERVTAKDILEFCQQQLPDHAIPKSVTFTEKLPRNPAGKVLKRVLREQYHP